MSFSNLIDKKRYDVDARLDQLFPENARDSRLIGAMRYALLSPGKRLRPLITLFSWSDNGGEGVIPTDAACAIEVVHAASLIMDDLPSMDNARLRRGRLATHVVFGEGPSMLAAVTLVSEAYRLIASGPAGGPLQKLRAISHLAAAIGIDGLAGGQERDIMCRDGTETKSLREIEQRHREKTGALFAAAAAIGAELAGAEPETVQKMKDYGAAFGLAYQAFDDVVDLESTSESTGKDAWQDKGMSTVVSLLGSDGALHSASRWLERAISIAQDSTAQGEPRLSQLAVCIREKFGAVFAVSDAASETGERSFLQPPRKF